MKKITASEIEIRSMNSGSISPREAPVEVWGYVIKKS
jgi:hypothetical protein